MAERVERGNRLVLRSAAGTVSIQPCEKIFQPETIPAEFGGSSDGAQGAASIKRSATIEGVDKTSTTNSDVGLSGEFQQRDRSTAQPE